MPQSIYDEAERNAHHDSVARFSMSSVQHEINTLKKVVPTAAAIAIATVRSPQVAEQLKKAEGPEMHQGVSELAAPGVSVDPATAVESRDLNLPAAQ